MEGILDFSRELDVALLDRVATAFFSGHGQEQKTAMMVLTQFEEHPDAWTRADIILERSQVPQSKYIALQVLEKLIKTRWKILPAEQSQGIRNYIVGLIIRYSSDEVTMKKEKTFLNKLNMVLVQILKQEWPHNWPTFISEICASSKTSIPLCENNMVILKLLSEEVFDFGEEEMTQRKQKALKDQMCGEFSEIFQLCREVLEQANKASLLAATLETLLRFLNWIPLGYVFETNIVDILVKMMDRIEFRNVTLKCLTEIGSLVVGPEYDNKFVMLFEVVMAKIAGIVPPETNFAQVYDTSNDRDQQFVQNLALFITGILGVHLKAVESDANREALIMAHMYLVNISYVEEREMFKVCLDYWSRLVADLYQEIQQRPLQMSGFQGGLFNGGMLGSPVTQPPNRAAIYAPIFERLRVVMIERMVKPEEVLVVENDEGEVVREFIKETDTITLYKGMRECLVYLTHLDVVNTEEIMTEKLSRQMDGSEWSWNNLSKLCWAIGSISGAMNEDAEKRFLVTVIKNLLNLVEMKRGKDNKAIVASNIMYIVGQYPRFLKAHWRFLKTVVNKLFEFMHELHEGVQDMACDTFIKIAKQCRRHFVLQQVGEVRPFIDEILEFKDQTTNDLQPHQVHTFYEAVGHMIAAQTNVKYQEPLLAKAMSSPNAEWDRILSLANQSPDALSDDAVVRQLVNILKTDTAMASSLGAGFQPQLARNFMDMLALYRTMSNFINKAVLEQGPVATRTPRVRHMRGVKKEILKLVQTFVESAEDSDIVARDYLPPLLDATLGDYGMMTPPARDAEVLSATAAIMEKLQGLMSDKVQAILDAVFSCTLEMISQDFSEFPEHRVGFFALIKAINSHCFSALLRLPQPQFKLVLDSIIWAFKHTHRDIQDTGLTICLELINNIAASDTSTANGFYQAYFLSLLQDIFFVLTDREHKSGFKGQCLVLARLFELVSNGEVVAPLYQPGQVSNPNMSNQDFLAEHVTGLLRNAFPHLQAVQIQGFIRGLFELNRNPVQFKLHVRDFLIQLKEFAGDTADLYLEEREQELERKKQMELETAMQVPGLMKPSDMPMMDEEL